jgi:hypothetical protein
MNLANLVAIFFVVWGFVKVAKWIGQGIAVGFSHWQRDRQARIILNDQILNWAENQKVHGK